MSTELTYKEMEIVTTVAKTLAEASHDQSYRGQPGNAMMAIFRGRALGLDPVAALESIAMIRGKMSLYGDGFLAVIQCHPHYTGHEEMTMEEIQAAGKAVCTFYRNGRPHKATYSVEDAKRQKLWATAGPWSTIPARMLQMRARGFAGRNAFSDALKGLVIREEAEDLRRIEVREAGEELQGVPEIETRQIRAQLAPPKEVEAVVEVAAPKANKGAAPKANKAKPVEKFSGDHPTPKKPRPRQKPPAEGFAKCPN